MNERRRWYVVVRNEQEGSEGGEGAEFSSSFHDGDDVVAEEAEAIGEEGGEGKGCHSGCRDEWSWWCIVLSEEGGGQSWTNGVVRCDGEEGGRKGKENSSLHAGNHCLDEEAAAICEAGGEEKEGSCANA